MFTCPGVKPCNNKECKHYEKTISGCEIYSLYSVDYCDNYIPKEQKMIYVTKNYNLKTCKSFMNACGGTLTEVMGDRSCVVVKECNREEYQKCQRFEDTLKVVIDSDIKGLRMEKR